MAIKLVFSADSIEAIHAEMRTYLAAATSTKPAQSLTELAEQDAQREDAAAKAAAEETKAANTTTDAPAKRGRGRRNTAADDKKDEKAEEKEEEKTADASAATGRRSRKSAGATNANPVNDTPEQAELRDTLKNDLIDLGGVPEAHTGVREALQRAGADSLALVPSAVLEAFNTDIQALIAEFFDESEE